MHGNAVLHGAACENSIQDSIPPLPQDSTQVALPAQPHIAASDSNVAHAGGDVVLNINPAEGGVHPSDGPGPRLAAER